MWMDVDVVLYSEDVDVFERRGAAKEWHMLKQVLRRNGI